MKPTLPWRKTESPAVQHCNTYTTLDSKMVAWFWDCRLSGSTTSFWVMNTCDTWSVSSTHCSTNKLNKSSTTSLCYVIKSRVLTPPICPNPSQDGTNTATPFPCKLKTHLLRTYITSPASISLPFLAYPTATSNICSCQTMIVLLFCASFWPTSLFILQQCLLRSTIRAPSAWTSANFTADLIIILWIRAKVNTSNVNVMRTEYWCQPLIWWEYS